MKKTDFLEEGVKNSMEREEVEFSWRGLLLIEIGGLRFFKMKGRFKISKRRKGT